MSCDHIHSTTCDQCEQLRELEAELLQCTSSKLPWIADSVPQEIEHIHNWKKHIVRTINQDQSKLNILQGLQSHQVLIIMDWAMKFLPRKYREKQSDWFGQRGKNWHVSVIIFKASSGELRHRTYTHIFESAKQDWFCVASILEHTLHTIRQQMPHIEEACIRSDNAGCYHCAPLWLTIPGLSERTAQSGKSYCDAKIAHMRTKMKTYVATGHDILTAIDMKTAIDDGKGVVGCQVCVGKIDVSKQVISGHKMKNITLYNEVDFHSSGMTMRQAYGIGPGITFSNDEIKSFSTTQGETGFDLINDFSVPYAQEGKVHEKQPPTSSSVVEFTTGLFMY
uniref:Uncharacterized protein LOC111115550 isoform X2 n=1 Tax=Crassostrea virginica TaxID=6565 RepID=A0A8B8C532_CRAVI|nr:uncharacterized protein LOC111115550 isoform X2 [Crassostrea virginica]